jgi:hypothetical protein
VHAVESTVRTGSTWLLTYTYGAKPFQVIANGATGAIAGQYPKSA